MTSTPPNPEASSGPPGEPNDLRDPSHLGGADEHADAGQTRLRECLERQFADAHAELLGTLFYCVGNHEDALDALQETFLKCWRHRDQIDTVANLRAWVFRIAINTGRDYRKSAWNRRRESLDTSPPSESTMHSSAAMNRSAVPPPDEELIRQEQLAQVRRALMDLREGEREVFLLRQNGDLTYEQIAQAINVPIGTVKTRMRTAIAHLRQAVGAQS